MTTDDFVFVVVNDGEVSEFTSKHLLDKTNAMLIVLAEDVWFDSKKRIKWNYSYRILISPARNFKYGWLNDEQVMDVIKYQDIHTEAGVGTQRSILRQMQNMRWD